MCKHFIVKKYNKTPNTTTITNSAFNLATQRAVTSHLNTGTDHHFSGGVKADTGQTDGLTSREARGGSGLRFRPPPRANMITAFKIGIPLSLQWRLLALLTVLAILFIFELRIFMGCFSCLLRDLNKILYFCIVIPSFLKNFVANRRMLNLQIWLPRRAL